MLTVSPKSGADNNFCTLDRTTRYIFAITARTAWREHSIRQGSVQNLSHFPFES